LLIWRNVGERCSTNTVRDIPIGWRFEDNYYTAVIKVDNANGYTIDLGQREAIIDEDIPVRGKVTIPYGIHTFRTHKDNWLYVEPNATSLSDLILKDPLYPHNHKLLIEGYTYNSSYDDEKIYTGVDRYAAYLMKPVDLRLFKTLNDDEYGKYAVVTKLTDGSYSYNAIVVKFDPSNDDYTNEKFIIDIPSYTEKWDSIQFIAVLETRDSSVSPMFSKYMIRLSL